MNLFHRLFPKRSKPHIPPMPSWETIVQLMYDRQLDGMSRRWFG